MNILPGGKEVFLVERNILPFHQERRVRGIGKGEYFV